MSAGRSACLCWTLLSVCLLASSSAGQTNIRAEPGQTVSLPCKALNNDPVIVVEWSRTDLEEEESVLVYRDEMVVTDNQHQSYKNRVDLQDRQMKDGDVSLILKNVTTEDRGTYKCSVVQRETNRRKRDTDPIKSIGTIRLEVVPAGGHLGLIAAVGVVAVLVVVVSLIAVRNKKKSSPPPSSPPLQSADQLLV